VDTNNGAFDVDGYDCAFYESNAHECVADGGYDTVTFTLENMCCGCGGGSIRAGTSTTTPYIVSPIGCPPDSGLLRHILDRDECSAAAVALELASTNAVVNQGSNRRKRPKQYGDMLSPSFVFLPVFPGLCWLGC